MGRRFKLRDMGSSISFTSASNNNVDCGADFIGTGNITFCGWIKARGLGESSQGTIIDNGKYRIRLSSTFQIQISADISTYASSAAGAIVLNNWQFISITRTTAGVSNIYINGVLSGTADQAGGTPAAGVSNVLLGTVVALSRDFNGKIDGVRIFNRILTVAEIQDLYYDMKLPDDSATSMLAEYTFNEGAGTTAYDTSGNGRNGTITGATYSEDVPMRLHRYLQPSTKCIDFSGATDEVDLGTDFIGTSAISVSAWVKIRGIGGTNSGVIITNGRFRFSLASSSGIKIRLTSNNASNNVLSNTVPLNTWIHVVGVRTADGTATIFVNGQTSLSTSQNSGTPASALSNAIVGNRNAGDMNFNGQIANLIVHNKVLTQQEISDLYYKGAVPDGALANFTFDNTLKDSSGNGHDGTATGTTFSTDVRDVARSAVSANTRLGIRGFGTSVNFDGVNGSRVGLGAVISQIDLTKSFTFSCWVNPNIAYAGNIFTQYDTTINSVFAIGLQSNQIRSRLRNISGATDVGSASSGNFPIPTYKWSHVVYTWDTVSAKLYINNSLQSGTTVNGITSTNNAIAYIGARNNGQNVWNGKIDQVRVFSKALSAQEVNDLYLKGDYPTGNLINQYLFDENTGTTANDSIGNNDGTLTGGVSWSADVPMLARQAV